MTDRERACSFGDLVDYLQGELPDEKEHSLEDHLFSCSRCAEDLAVIERITAAIGDVVRAAEVGAVVTGAFLERAAAGGLSLREYRIEPGQTVSCAAGPEDFFVVRLAAALSQAGDLRLHGEMRDLESGATQPLPVREVVRDDALGEVLMVFPGAVVRTYPRSLWTLSLETASGASLGPYVLDHTP